MKYIVYFSIPLEMDTDDIKKAEYEAHYIAEIHHLYNIKGLEITVRGSSL